MNFKENIRCNITKEQKKIEAQMFKLLDEYEKNNSFENREFLCYLTAAIFLVYKEKYPQIAKYLLFRTKSDMSFMKNIQKEFIKFITTDTQSNQFDISAVDKDISGIKFVLDNINYSLPATAESRELFGLPDIKKLRKQSKDNLDFIDTVEEFISSPIHNSREFYQFQLELLKRIIEVTPKKFKNERFPNQSYEELYEQSQIQYNYYIKNDNFPTSLSERDIGYLEVLLNDLRSKVDNNLHFEILNRTLPIVLDDPLIKNTLLTTFKLEKSNEQSQKANGFEAIYYTLNTPFGKVEFQAQSNRAYFNATKGSAYHSGIPGKSINVKHFFELVDKNDEHTLDYYLDTLDSISADSIIHENELPQFESEQERKAYLETSHGKDYINSKLYIDMMKHIKIKDTIDILPPYLPNSVYDKAEINYKTPRSNWKINEKKLNELIESGEIKLSTVDTNMYFLASALSISPYMNVASSGHSSFTTVGNHNKKIVGEFSEAIRKKDSNTLLRDILVRRLENILENPEEYFDLKDEKQSAYVTRYLDLAKQHEEIASRLPKDIPRKNIIHYGNRLREITSQIQTGDRS